MEYKSSSFSSFSVRTRYKDMKNMDMNYENKLKYIKKLKEKVFGFKTCCCVSGTKISALL